MRRSQPGHVFAEPALAALQMAVESNDNNESVLYTFVDRLLFALETQWRSTCLADLEQMRATGLLVIERSEVAWATHPANYREIEAMQSRAFELLHGRWLELTPGAYLFSADAAAVAAKGATARDAGVWTEWVLLAFSMVSASKPDQPGGLPGKIHTGRESTPRL